MFLQIAFLLPLLLTPARGVDIAGIQALLGNLPSLIAYWPLTRDFDARDATATHLDGTLSASLTSVVGPFGIPDAALQTGNYSNAIRYIKFNSSLLDFRGSSWTIAMFVKAGSGVQPFFDYYFPTTLAPGANLFEYPATNQLYLNPRIAGMPGITKNCTVNNVWQFVAGTYDHSNLLLKLFCNNTYLGTSNITAGAPPNTTNILYIGHREATPNFNANASFSCISIYGTALNQADLANTKQLCQLYHDITCSPNCILGTCRVYLTAPNGWECTCNASWTGATCSVPMCSPSCQHGGNCTSSYTCNCSAQWTGGICQTPVCSPSCQHGGNCTNPNVCTCPSQWTGTICQTPLCSPICQHGGNCTSPNVCTCPSQWNGTLCQTPVCSPSCQNGGTCISPNTCTCPGQWTGTTCATAVCSPVCQNGGTCSSPNTCNCSAQWTGGICQTPVCSPSCQHGGNCTNPNVCTCPSQWNGTICQTPVCSPSCQHGGTCTNPNICTCPSQWNGTLCQTPVCSPSCQNGGTCISPNTCTCPGQWTGTTCATAVCSPSCQNGGTCTSPNICTCPRQWTGKGCQTPICSPSCQNGGICSSPNNCICTSQWSGTTCGTPVCSQACQNGGICASPNTCTCQSQWNGTTCANAVCSPSCQNGGTCSSPDICTCPSQWNGTICEKPICSQSCQNSGNCTAPDQCTCAAGWVGSVCDTPGCNPACQNGGTCTPGNICSCPSSWNGTQCEIPLCSSPCLNAGTCSAPNTCTCSSQWNGTTCEIPVCSPSCMNGGTCSSPNTCTCPAQWNGAVCETPVCSTPCQNGGACTNPDTCSCLNGFTGAYCESVICWPPCQNSGTCSSGTCICNSGWTGPTCETPVCSFACLNGGTCSSPDTCTCLTNWKGLACGLPCIADADCQNAGICNNPGLCSCPPAWTGTWCETSMCPNGYCKNGGTCSGNATCDCTIAWWGPTCAISNSSDPLLANGTKEALLDQATILANKAIFTAGIGKVNASFAEELSDAVLDFFVFINAVANNYWNLLPTGTFGEDFILDLTTDYAKKADNVMQATDSLETKLEDDLGQSSIKCDQTKSGVEMFEANPTTNSQVPAKLNTDQAQMIYRNLTQWIDSSIKLVREVLNSGKEYRFDGRFFSTVITNLKLKEIPGLEIQTSLARVNFPDIHDSPLEMFTDPTPGMNENSTVTAAMVAYVENVFDISQPFNVPTISVKLFFNRTAQILNRAKPITVVGVPIVRKEILFRTQKVEYQCDVSKVQCDLATNGDTFASLATFPVLPYAGDFMLIFPPIGSSYSAYISFKSTPNIYNYTWALNVTAKGVTIRDNSDLPTPKTHLFNDGELRVLISKTAIEAAFSIYKTFDYPLGLFVVMKQNLSAFGPIDDLPSSACVLQHCYGYHLRVGFASNSKLSKIAYSRRRRVANSDISSDDLELDASTTESGVVFKSKYFGDFGADLLIKPSTIEFTDIFGKFSTLLADNYAVLGFAISAVASFLLGVVIAYWLDKRDLERWAFLPIESNRQFQSYKYLVSVSHYAVRNFEQNPKVLIRLTGNLQDTSWRLLEDGQRKNFDGKRPANFILATYVPIGRLEAVELKILTGFKPRPGEKPFEMTVEKVIVVDLTKRRKYVFLVKTKLNRGKYQKVSLATEDDINGFRYLISSHSRVGMSESHPWLSIAQRPLPSNWTRAERLGCVVSALFMAMLVNAMFYGQETAAPRIGIKVANLFRISWFTVWTSVVGSVIIIPPTAIMAFIFKRIRRRSGEMSQFTTVFKLRKREETVPSDPNAKKPFRLPFQCVYIAWTLVAACVGTSGFFIVMYSLSWGKDKSLQWLSGMVMHIVQDILVIQTVKVLLSSVFNSTILNLPDDGLDVGKMTFSKYNTKQQTELFLRLRSVIGGIFHHLLYVVTFALVIGTAYNSQAFNQVRDLRPLVFVSGYRPLTGVITDYSAIFTWLQTKLLANLLNGNQILYGGIFGASNIYKVLNHDVVLIGPIRLRQQRVARASCQLKASFVQSYTGRYSAVLSNGTWCQNEYYDTLGFGGSSETRSFKASWQNEASFSQDELANLSTSLAPWVYRETDGPPYSGWQGTYKTGGFYVDLPTRRLSNAQTVVSQLTANRWLDNATSVLFVDFILYNAQVNIFVAAKVVFEAMSAGGMTYYTRLYPLNLYQYSGANSMLSFFLQGIWIILQFSHVLRVIIQIKKIGLGKFCRNGWNLFDLCQILISTALIGLFSARIYVIIGTINRLRNDRASFANLDLLVNWEDLMFNMYGIALFMTLLLFFRHLQANKYWAIFLGTLSKGKNDLVSFVAIFTLITVMFAGLGNTSLGATCFEFRTFAASLTTLLQNVIGVSGPLMSLASTSRFVMVFCMAYSFIVMFLAVQIFMTIIAYTYGFVESDVEANTDWDFALADYMSKEWQKLFERKMGPSMKQKGNVAEKVFKPIGEKNSAQLECLIERLRKYVERKVDEEMVAEDSKHERSFLAWSLEQLKKRRNLVLLKEAISNPGSKGNSLLTSSKRSTSLKEYSPALVTAIRNDYIRKSNSGSTFEFELYPVTL